MGASHGAFLCIRAWLLSRRDLAAENLALRQQLAVLKKSSKRPKLRPRDRVFWVWLSWWWPDWRSVLVIVKPETVIRWHRQGFRLYWRWKSEGRPPGRPQIQAEVRALIRRMSKENPTWGAPRIQSELTLLGHALAESTVAKYMLRPPTPPSQTWRTFLDNHVPDLASNCERVIGSIRRECVDRLIILNEVHPKRILTDYFDYYHRSRTHLSLERNSPMARKVEPPSKGQVIVTAQVGGLHHRYTRAA